MVTQANQWNKSVVTKELELPSGNVALVKRVPMDQLIARGSIPNSLLGIVEEEVNNNSGKNPGSTSAEEQAKKAATLLDKDPSALADIFSFADQVVLECVVQPVITLREPGEANPEVLYLDEVALDDKMFIFNWAVGGTTDLSRFREESTSIMEHLQSGQKLELPTE